MSGRLLLSRVFDGGAYASTWVIKALILLSPRAEIAGGIAKIRILGTKEIGTTDCLRRTSRCVGGGGSDVDT